MNSTRWPESTALIIAKDVCRRLGYPDSAYQAFRSHFHSAARRRIPFNMTFIEWFEWWQQDGRWERRGVGIDHLVMARFGDVGPYALDNIYCTTHQQNVRDTDQEARIASYRRTLAAAKSLGHKHHLEVRGYGHPKSHAVMTPSGIFGSAALAADHYGITRQAASQRARKEILGWRWVDILRTRSEPRS